MTLDPGRFRVLTFDCYGTLIDWERGLGAVLGSWAARAGLKIPESTLLEEFARAESEAQRQHPRFPYRDILAEVHGRLAARFQVRPDVAEAAALAGSVGDWPAFVDTVEALQRLATRYKLVVVSNVDRVSFVGTQRALGIQFSAVVTAEDVGAYKPDARMFERAVDVSARLGAEPGEILHVAQSLYHDIVPAHRQGLAVAWVNRRHASTGWGATPPPDAWVTPDVEVRSLGDLADLLIGPGVVS